MAKVMVAGIHAAVVIEFTTVLILFAAMEE